MSITVIVIIAKITTAATTKIQINRQLIPVGNYKSNNCREIVNRGGPVICRPYKQPGLKNFPVQTSFGNDQF